MLNKISAWIFTLAFFGSSFANSPNWHLEGGHEGWKDEWLAIHYFHHSEMQRQWAWHLLGTVRFSGQERILDFGCGDGKISAKLSHFIPQGNITGVDLSSSMIAIASRCFPSAVYPNLSFKTSSDIHFSDETDSQTYDLIVSFCVFHLLSNPIQVLKNLHARLEENGTLLLVVPCGNNPAFFQAAGEIFEQHQLPIPWANRQKDTNTETMRTKEGCVHCLTAAGFEPISIVPLHTPTAFFSKQELIEWMVGTVTANWQIPLETAGAFFNKLVDRMAELDPEVIDSSGAYRMKLSRIEVIAKRKYTETT